MRICEVGNFSRQLSDADAAQVIERCARLFGLTPTMRSQNSARPHWHFQRPPASGTLEVTFDPRKQSLIVSVHRNREGANQWARDECLRFAQTLARELNGNASLPRDL